MKNKKGKLYRVFLTVDGTPHTYTLTWNKKKGIYDMEFKEASVVEWATIKALEDE